MHITVMQTLPDQNGREAISKIKTSKPLQPPDLLTIVEVAVADAGAQSSRAPLDLRLMRLPAWGRPGSRKWTPGADNLQVLGKE